MATRALAPGNSTLLPVRAAAVALSVWLAAALLVGLDARPAAGGTIPSLPHEPILALDPGCGAEADDVGEAIILTVRGYNFVPGSSTDIYYTEFGDSTFAGNITVGQYGYFEQQLSFYHVGDFEVRAWTSSSFDDVSTLLATTYFESPCSPFIALNPPCLDPFQEATVEVTGTSFLIRFPITLSLEGPAGTIGEPVETSTLTGSFTATLGVPPLPAGEYIIVARQRDLFATLVDLPIPCPTPLIQLVPRCGPAGAPLESYLLTVMGSGFKPNQGVEFVFDAFGSPQIFLYAEDLPEPGDLGQQLIAPYMRPPSDYVVIARQHDGYGHVVREASATFTVECLPATAAVTPGCGPPEILGDIPRRYALTVTGADFEFGTAQITFDALVAAGITPEVYPVDVGTDGTFSLPIDPAYRPAGTYEVRIEQQKRDGTLTVIALPFVVPCVEPSSRIELMPLCGPYAAGQPDAYEIVVTGSGFIPGFVELVFDADTSPELDSTFADETGDFEHTLTPGGRAAGTYRIVARQQDRLRVLADESVDFVVSCDDPILHVVPESGPPGLVVTAVGENFPPNTTVFLRWSQGIDRASGIEALTDANGAFRRQVLLFHHDFMGARTMTVELPADPSALAGVSAIFVVVPGRGSPPAYTIFGADPVDSGTIVIRR